jgi:hypothetical protein
MYVHRRTGFYRRLQLRVRDRLPTSFREHEAIVEAIIIAAVSLNSLGDAPAVIAAEASRS